MAANTPAGRLLAIFDEMLEIGTRAPFRTLWAATLNYEASTADEVAHMGEMARLLRQIELAANSVADSGAAYDRESLLHAYPQWAAAVFGWGLTLTPQYDCHPTDLISSNARNSLAATHNLLAAAAREGVLPEHSKSEILDHVSHVVSEMLGWIQADPDIPEYIKIQLAGRLVEVRQSIRMVAYRGDQAVGVAIQVASADMASVADPAHHAGDAKSALQQRLESWSETLAVTSRNFFAALSMPMAVSYFLTTGDATGAGFILATSSPAAVEQASKLMLEKGNDDPASSASESS